MAWTNDKWTQEDSLNFGFPFTSSPALKNISKSKSIWKIDPELNFGFPYVTTMEEKKDIDPVVLQDSAVYKLYYDKQLFYRSDLPTPTTSLVNGVLSLKSSASGSLSFTITKENIIYDILKRMKGNIEVTKNDRLIWEGRILSEDIDFWYNKNVYCEGIMSCLNDTRHPQKIYKDMTLREYMQALLSIHNQKVDESKHFEIGIVTANNNSDIGTRTTSYESTWDLFKSLVDEYGGYLSIRYSNGTRYVDYRKKCSRTSYQKIEFGINLLDFTKNYDMSSLCTVLLPLGKMVASAGNNAIGEVIDSRLAAGHFISPDDFDIYYDSSTVDSYSGSNTYFPVEAGKTYYISCRNQNGRVMWALKDSSGNIVDHYSAGSGVGFTDLVEYKLEVPQSDVGNMYQLAIAGYGVDIQPRVNSSIEADESFDKYTTVEEVNSGSLYITNEEAITNYGWIEKQLTWNNIDDPSELKKVAERYLKDSQFDEMTLSVSAVDLQLMGVKADWIDLLDEVWVVSKPHGLNKTFPVTELSIDLCSPSANKFTLGSKTEQTLSGVMADANDDIFSKLNAIPSQSATLKSAQDNATMLINNAVSGIFMLEYNENGVNTGFRISNVPDWSADGAKGWRFNIGGLGYFGNGFNQPVTLALTGEDGGIVANSITTGQMLATRIRGGTLGLGHWQMEDGSYIDGQLQIADSNGNIIVNMNQNGAFVKGILESSGRPASGGPETVHIENGWIYGSDPNAGHLSMDTSIEGYKGVSIDTNVMAICVFDRLFTARNRDISDLEAVVGYDEFTVTGLSGNEVTISVKNGFIVGIDIHTQQSNGLEARISDLEDRVSALEGN